MFLKLEIFKKKILFYIKLTWKLLTKSKHYPVKMYQGEDNFLKFHLLKIDLTEYHFSYLKKKKNLWEETKINLEALEAIEEKYIN